MRLGFFSQIKIEALKLEPSQAGGLWIPDVRYPPKSDQVAADAQALDGARATG